MSRIDDYIECALWASTHFESEECEGIPFDQVEADFAPETLKTMEEELDEFFCAADEILAKHEGVELSEAQMAHDFWLTRNGHGAGFWDRGLGKLGDELTELCRPYGSLGLYLGEDGMIYTQ